MGRELIRRATAALEHAVEARTVEFQARHADEARYAFEQAVRSARARFEAAERKPNEAARVIARRAVTFEMEQLQALESELMVLEARIADAITRQSDPRDFRLRLADG